MSSEELERSADPDRDTMKQGGKPMAKKVTEGERPCQRKGCTNTIDPALSAAAQYCSASCRTMQSRQKRKEEEEAKRTATVVTSASAMNSDPPPNLSTGTDNPRASDATIPGELTDLLTLLERQHRTAQETFQKVLAGFRSELVELPVFPQASINMDAQLKAHGEREEQLHRDLNEAHEQLRQQQSQLTLRAEQEALLRSELAEAQEQLRQQQSQLTLRAEQEALLRSELAAAHEHNHQQQHQLTLRAEQEALLRSELTAELKAKECELQEVRSQLTAKEGDKPTSVNLDISTTSARFLLDAEKEALQKFEDMTQWCAGIRDSVHRLLPWVSHRAGHVSTWSQSDMASRSYWKHPLVPALGAELAPIARRCVDGCGLSVSKSVNQMLPFAVLSAQVYLSVILSNDRGQRPSDETTLAVVLASIEQAPEFYPPTLLGFAREEPLTVQLATLAAIKLIEQRFSRLYRPQPDSAYVAGRRAE